jgi:four helix bundle protein
MGTIKNFEDLEVWKMSRELVKFIYSDFIKCRDFTFRDQISRAGISSMNNISEGFCRSSDTEFRHFLNISKGSVGEVKSMYYIAEDLKYVHEETALERRNLAQRIINGNSSLMRYLNPPK